MKPGLVVTQHQETYLKKSETWVMVREEWNGFSTLPILTPGRNALDRSPEMNLVAEGSVWHEGTRLRRFLRRNLGASGDDPDSTIRFASQQNPGQTRDRGLFLAEGSL